MIGVGLRSHFFLTNHSGLLYLYIASAGKKVEDLTIDDFEITQLNTHLAPGTLRFCIQQGLLKHLSDVVELIEKCFPSLQGLHLEPERDPETEEEWLVIDITVEDEVDNFLDRYNSYTDQLISLVPWPERDKIRLSYNLI